MDRFVDRFESHATTGLVRQLNEKIDVVREIRSENESTALEVAHFLKIATIIANAWRSSDPHLVSLQFLQAVQKPLQQTINHLKSFISSPTDHSQIVAANDQLDSLLFQIGKRLPAPELGADGYSEAIKVYSKSIEGYQEALSSKLEEFVKLVSVQTDDAQIKSNEFGNWISEKGMKTEEAVSELESQLSDVRSQVEAQRSEFLGQFQASQDRNKKRVDDLVTKSEARIDDHFIKFSESAAGSLAILESLREDAETVFGVVQNTVQAGAHQTYATEEHKTADRFRLGAISLMFLAVIIIMGPEVLRLVQIEENYVFEVNQALKRAVLSGIIFVPALYMAKESSTHRKQGFQNKRTELTLRTLDPYLSLIDNEERKQDLKIRIAEGIFGDKKDIPAGDDNTGALAQATALVNQLSKIVNK